ncbi:MAG: T9SS type A sorting domain-containing protein [Bacteroidota bacterium]
MIRVSLGLILWLTPVFSSAQDLFNASFDSICVCAIDRIYGWVTSDVYYLNPDTIVPFEPNRQYSTPDHELHFAINSVNINYDQGDTSGYANSLKLFTRPETSYPSGEPFKGFITNGTHFYTDSSGLVDFSRGGSPFPYRPYFLTGRYKFEDSLSAVDDFGKAVILLKSYDSLNQVVDTIAYSESVLDLNPTLAWTPFEIPIHYQSSNLPDSIVIVFFSASTGADSTTLWLDDIGFVFSLDGIEDDRNGLPPIYPNPAQERIYLPYPGTKPTAYRILDMRGAMIQSGKMLDEVDVSGLHRGMYILQVESETGTFANGRFIKQ